MAKEVFEPSPGAGGPPVEGPYITNGWVGADQSGAPVVLEGTANAAPPSKVVPMRPPSVIVPTPDPNMGDPREVGAADLEAMRQAAARAPLLSQPPPPMAPSASGKEFLLYVPLGSALMGVVKIVGPQELIDAESINLLVDHLILHRQSLERREGNKK